MTRQRHRASIHSFIARQRHRASIYTALLQDKDRERVYTALMQDKDTERVYTALLQDKDAELVYTALRLHDVNSTRLTSVTVFNFTPSRTLRSASDTLSLQIPRTRRSTVGFRAFSVFGPANVLYDRSPIRLLSNQPSIHFFFFCFFFFFLSPKTIDLPCRPFHAQCCLPLPQVCLLSVSICRKLSFEYI